MSASRSTTQPRPGPATPAAPDNGVPEQPTLAVIQAKRDQARAELAALEAQETKMLDAQATALRKEQLAEATTAAKAFVAEADGEADLAKLAEAAKVVWIKTTEMAKAAKVRTGASRSRGPAGGDVRPGSDADVVLTFLKDNPGYHTVRVLAEAVATAKGYTHNADGQVKNAAEKLRNIGLADRIDSPFRYRIKDTSVPEVLAGVTMTEGTEPP